MQTVGSSKVHADTEGIVNSLDDAFRADFERYVRLNELDPTLLAAFSESVKEGNGLSPFGIPFVS